MAYRVLTPPSSPDSPPFIMVPDKLTWKEVDIWIHHGGKLLTDEEGNWISYDGGEELLLQGFDYEKIHETTILNMPELIGRYTRKKRPIGVYWRDPQFKIFDLAIDSMESDISNRFFVEMCKRDDVNEVHLYVKHREGVDTPIPASAEDIEMLQRQQKEEEERQQKMQEDEECRRKEEEERNMQEEHFFSDGYFRDWEDSFGEEDDEDGGQADGGEGDGGQADDGPTDPHCTPLKKRQKSCAKGRRYSSQKRSRTMRRSYKTKGRFKITTPLPASPPRQSSSAPTNASASTSAAPTSAAQGGHIDSDGYTTEELRSPQNSDSEADHDMRFPEFNEDNEIPQLALGMEFPNLETFKNAVKEYSIHHGREIDFVKNDKLRVRAECIEKKPTDPLKEACPWTILCSKNVSRNTYQVKTYNDEHKCARRLENRLATREWVAQKLVPQVRCNPSMTGQMAFEWILQRFRLAIHDAMGYRAVNEAHKICEGEEKAQYSKLRDYANELLKCNPRSSVFLQVHPDNHQFERLYICLKACKDAFLEGCRPLIGLDGCFLKGYYGGQLLAAVSQDGNNSNFLIAYAIVEVEDKDTWSWFVTNLLEDLGDPQGEKFTFISDMQKGLEIALADICPAAPHRFCCRHIYANFSKKWKGLDFKKAFWNCAKASTPQHFEQAMDVMRRLSPDAVDWLNRRPPHKWSRSGFDTVCKNPALTSNMCEQFNGAIMKYRGKPIIALAEGVRSYVTAKMGRSQAVIDRTNGRICIKVKKKLESMMQEAVFWTPHWSRDPENSLFEVTCPPHSKCVVDLNKKTCSCRFWDISGIPCQHAIACLRHRHDRPEDYVCDWLTQETNKKLYSYFIMPVPGEMSWVKTNTIPVEPPNFKRRPGRPKLKRRKAPEEEAASSFDPTKLKRKVGPHKCSRCGQLGHNSRRCKGGATAQPSDGSGHADPVAQSGQNTPAAPPNQHMHQGRGNPPITRETMQGASSGTFQRFASFFDANPPA